MTKNIFTTTNIPLNIASFFLFFFVSLATFAQTTPPDTTYRWQWAKTGGSSSRKIDDDIRSSSSLDADMEQVKGVVVDKNNNIVIAAQIGGGTSQFAGQSVTTHNYSANSERTYGDAYIAKTDCEGNFLWDYVAGTETLDLVYSTGKDSLDNIYVSMWLPNTKKAFFGNDTTLTRMGSSYNPQRVLSNRTLVLMKLDASGILQWLHFPEVERAVGLDSVAFVNSVVEADGTQHTLFDVIYPHFLENYQVEIDSADLEYSDLYVFKHNKDGEFIGAFPLPAKHLGSKHLYTDDFRNHVYFHFDTVAKQYYLFGNIVNSKSQTGIINSDTIAHFDGYIAAFDTLGNHLWHYNTEAGVDLDGGFNQSMVLSINTDEQGNIYAFMHSKNVGNSTDTHFHARLLKFASDGTILWNTRLPKHTRSGPVVYSNGEIAVFSNLKQGDWGNFSQGRSEFFVARYLASNGVQIAYDSWMSETINNGLAAGVNAATCGTTDLHGNYIIGGAVGTKFYLSDDHSVSIENSGNHLDSDFFIAKYGRYTCSEPIPVGVNVPQVFCPTIYPNPTRGELYVQGETAGLQYAVYSVSGQRVIAGAMQQGHPISLYGLHAGAYILHLTNPTTKEHNVHKVILQ